MKISDAASQIMRDEGFHGKPYQDTEGKTTIGYGINLDNAPLTEEEGRLLTEHRVRLLGVELSQVLPWTYQTLDEARRGVLLNMAYNLGIHGLLGFKKTLAFVRDGNYNDAAVEMLDSRWAVQVGPRAHRLSEQMRTGEWQ